MKKTRFFLVPLMVMIVFSFAGCGNVDANNNAIPDNQEERSVTRDNDNAVDDVGDGIKDGVDGVVDGAEDLLDGNDNNDNNRNDNNRGADVNNNVNTNDNGINDATGNQ